MDYLCVNFKFGDFGLSRFGLIVRTDRQTESQMWMNAGLLTRLQGPQGLSTLRRRQ